MEEKDMAVDNGDLTIFYVRPTDAGVYQCKVGSLLGDLVVLEVLDDEDKYDVVKPETSRGPYACPPALVTSELVLFTSWSSWGECSRCSLVGRRRRYGYCYVGYGRTEKAIEAKEITSTSATALYLDDAEKLLLAFPGGLPCRSALLPKTLKESTPVTRRNNEIMIGMCKVPCTSDVFEVRTGGGELVERANNSDGAYSLSQGEPPRPPPVTRAVIFAAKGDGLVVKCPGTTLRDVPLSWRLGREEVAPKVLDTRSGGRVHLNARDHIVIDDVQLSDANVYSCWQRENLAGVVKLRVYEDTRSKYGRRLLLVGLFVCLCVAFRLTENLYVYQQRRYWS
ncbi:unnamed protein product, partial [Iphiclides podalirius]